MPGTCGLEKIMKIPFRAFRKPKHKNFFFKAEDLVSFSNPYVTSTYATNKNKIGTKEKATTNKIT